MCWTFVNIFTQLFYSHFYQSLLIRLFLTLLKMSNACSKMSGDVWTTLYKIKERSTPEVMAKSFHFPVIKNTMFLGKPERIIVCVCGCLHYVPRADSMHVLSMPRADFRPRANTFDVCCWFWHQIRTCHPWKPGIDHKIMGVVWVCPWHWNYFSNHFNYKWKSALGRNLAHSSPHFAC